MPSIQSRRDFLASASLAAASGLLGARAAIADEGPPETTTIRLNKVPGICIAPQYVADELLRTEGFTDVRYVPISSAIQHRSIMLGEVDFSLHFAAPLVMPIDAGEPITVLAGVHPGCFELFARDEVRTILDLKGKSVGIQAIGSSPHVFLTAMAAYVGLDPPETSGGSRARRSSRCSCSPRARSTPSSAFRPSPKSCARTRSAT